MPSWKDNARYMERVKASMEIEEAKRSERDAARALRKAEREAERLAHVKAMSDKNANIASVWKERFAGDAHSLLEALHKGTPPSERQRRLWIGGYNRATGEVLKMSVLELASNNDNESSFPELPKTATGQVRASDDVYVPADTYAFLRQKWLDLSA